MSNIPENGGKDHLLTLQNRRRLSIGGVIDVKDFDEGMITLVTSLGQMGIEGDELHITNLSLDTGKIEIDGIINSIYYYNSDANNKKGFFSRISK
jgi:sporulation protein YabP